MTQNKMSVDEILDELCLGIAKNELLRADFGITEKDANYFAFKIFVSKIAIAKQQLAEMIGECIPPAELKEGDSMGNSLPLLMQRYMDGKYDYRDEILENLTKLGLEVK